MPATAFVVPGEEEFHINTYTTNDQFGARACGRDDRSFVVSWHNYEQDGDQYGVFAQRFEGAGATVGTEIHVNSQIVDTQRDADVSVNDDGSFAIVWESEEYGDSDDSGVFGQRFCSDRTGEGSCDDVVCVRVATGGDLDPAADAARLVIRSGAGDALVDIEIPGGRDWTSNGAGTKVKCTQ